MSARRGPDMADPDHKAVLQFVQRQSRPFVTSQDVAEEFPEVTDKTIRKRLNDLVERDELESRRVGAHAKVWYPVNQAGDGATVASPSSVSQ
jgi:predicted ArsR family transcriptional regulator